METGAGAGAARGEGPRGLALCVLCGLPAAGKSTLARALSRTLRQERGWAVGVVAYDDVMPDAALEPVRARPLASQGGGRGAGGGGAGASRGAGRGSGGEAGPGAGTGAAPAELGPWSVRAPRAGCAAPSPHASPRAARGARGGVPAAGAGAPGKGSLKSPSAGGFTPGRGPSRLRGAGSGSKG